MLSATERRSLKPREELLLLPSPRRCSTSVRCLLVDRINNSRSMLQKRPHDFGKGGQCPLPAWGVELLWKFDYEMVHSEVYLNKYVVSTAPFSTPACPDCSQNITNIENCFFACFRLLIFHPFFQGVSWPHLPLCADARGMLSTVVEIKQCT